MPRLAPRRRRTTVVAAALAVALLGLLAVVGFQPEHADAGIADQLQRFLDWTDSRPKISWITFHVIERGANLVLFIPVGVVSYLLIPRRFWPVSLMVGPAGAFIIELGQWAFLPGRTASPMDIFLNSVGATVGVGLAALVSLSVAAREAKRRSALVPTLPADRPATNADLSRTPS